MFTMVVSRMVVIAPSTRTRLMRLSCRVPTGSDASEMEVITIYTTPCSVVSTPTSKIGGGWSAEAEARKEIMVTADTSKTLREGSAEQRAAILSAARELLRADGFERTSVDAIAARAGVSKRTVYDYYGDKRTLLLAVVEQAVQALRAAVSTAIDENLRDVHDVEEALTGFA